MGDGRRAAAPAGQRVGEQRDPGRAREGGERAAQPRVALGAARDEHGARARRELLGEPVDQCTATAPRCAAAA